MRQDTFSDSGFEKYHKKTRRQQFLEDMEKIIPWDELCSVIAPFYPVPKGAGRRPIGIDRMLRIYFMQHWFNLSDPGVEEALYDSVSLRQFAKIDLGRERVPDETTVLNFRHLMEQHNLGDQLFQHVNVYLAENGMKLSRGTIVDATIISAPSSTKNKRKERDPDMHQTRKGNQWYFGMKGHIGVDSKTKLIHSAMVSSANMHDSQALGELLHGNETRVWGDSAYSGQKAVIKQAAPKALDFTNKKGARNRPLSDEDKSKNSTKSKVRAKVEHQFAIIKRQFGFSKVRYKGIHKNAHHFFVSCALSNLVMARKHLLAT